MDDLKHYPLIGTIQNAVGMGFIGTQAVYAVANALGARAISAPTAYASAHGGFQHRSSWIAEPQQFRRDIGFLIAQRPAVLIVGFVPRPNLVDIIAAQLSDYKGIVLLDPVIGDYQKGLYVSVETARAIQEQLIPLAQIVTPNRFEAEVLLGAGGDEGLTEFGFLNGLYDLGPESVIVKSFERDPVKRKSRSLFTNGYSYYGINGPLYPRFPGHGVGDLFAAAVGAFTALGASPFAATLLATTLCARAFANTTKYGGETVDPVAALETWRPLGHHLEDERAMRFSERSGIQAEALKPKQDEGPRLKFAPPKHKIMYG